MARKRTPADVLLSLSVKEIVRRARVDASTARRWKRGDIIPSPGILLVLEGDLGGFHPAWSGWIINGKGELCSPENWICTPGEVRAMQLHQALVAAQRREIDILRYEVAVLERTAPWLEEQPEPGSLEFKIG
jgi:transcriptional regulator with XRE-family HTH domain